MAYLTEKDLTSDNLHFKLLAWFESTLQHPSWINFFKNAQEDFEFYEGKQWSDADIKSLTDRGQAPIVENEIKPIIDKVIGQYTSQKTRIGYKGRNIGTDETTANILSDCALFVQQQADYEYEEKEAFTDGIKSGFGVIETGIIEGIFPKVKLKYEDCLNIYIDPNSRRYDLSDAQYIHRAKWLSIDKARKSFPGNEDKITEGMTADVITNSIPTFKRENYYNLNNQMIRLIETWYKAEDGSIRVAVWCSNGLITDNASPYNHGLFPFVVFFCDRKKDGEPLGLIRGLKDPQREINKRRSKALHLLSTNQAIFEEGGVKDEDQLREEMARPDGLLTYRKGYIFAVHKNIDLAQTQMGLLQESKDAIKRISGMDQGYTQEVRSNAQLARKQAAEDIVIVPVFDNLRRTRKIIARHIYELIKQYFNDEMVFNVTDDQNAARSVALTSEHLQIIKEGTFDIIVEEMPETTTIQNEQFNMIAEMLRAMNLPPQMAMSMIPIMIKMSQLRNKEDILKQFTQMSGPQPDMPKISLSLTWDTLTPQEKAAMAQMMGQQELAQYEMQEGIQPAQVIKAQEGMQKIQMKVQGDLQKAQISKESPEQAAQQAQMEQEKHDMQMSQAQQKHDLEIDRTQQGNDVEMERADQQHSQKLAHAGQAHDMKMMQAAQQQAATQGAQQ